MEDVAMHLQKLGEKLDVPNDPQMAEILGKFGVLKNSGITWIRKIDGRVGSMIMHPLFNSLYALNNWYISGKSYDDSNKLKLPDSERVIQEIPMLNQLNLNKQRPQRRNREQERYGKKSVIE